jgi:type II secretory pathway pseudopilin PulG
MPRFFRHHRRAFTLVEMLVSIVALTAFVLIVTRLVNSASTITTIGNKHMGADSQARSLLDRMAVDFAQMVKRSDVDYYLKNGAAPNSVGGAMNGNDQIAFFGTVPGYYPASSNQSPVSLVAYRVNSNSSSTNPSYNKLERMGKGLIWNGTSSSYIPILFLDSTTSPTTTIANKWPTATSSSSTDPNYELIGPYVFRFEYYYLLKGQTVGGTTYSSILSYTPWDTRITGHTAVNGFQDVSAIGVTIAVIDPQSRALVSDTQLATLAGQMLDFSQTMHPAPARAPCGALGGAATQPGDLDAQWQCAVNATTAPFPRPAASAIRIYSRLFPIAR